MHTGTLTGTLVGGVQLRSPGTGGVQSKISWANTIGPLHKRSAGQIFMGKYEWTLAQVECRVNFHEEIRLDPGAGQIFMGKYDWTLAQVECRVTFSWGNTIGPLQSWSAGPIFMGNTILTPGTGGVQCSGFMAKFKESGTVV